MASAPPAASVSSGSAAIGCTSSDEPTTSSSAASRASSKARSAYRAGSSGTGERAVRGNERYRENQCEKPHRASSLSSLVECKGG
jgi:hypothetical protein